MCHGCDGCGEGAKLPVLNQTRNDRVARRTDFIPVALVLIVGAVLSAAMFAFVHSYYETIERQRFQSAAAHYSALFTGAVERHVNALKALRAFVSASDDVTRWNFSEFAEQTLPQNPGFQAVVWTPRVPEADRRFYESSFRADGLYGLRIREVDATGKLTVAKKRSAYLPVSYIEPLDGNQELIGLDLATVPAYRAVLDDAERSNAIAASPSIENAVVDNTRSSILVAFPLQRSKGAVPGSPTGKPLSGYALGVLSFDRLLQSVLPDGAPVEIAVASGKTGDRPALVISGSAAGVPLGDWLKASAHVQTSAFEIGGRSFGVALRTPIKSGASSGMAASFGVALGVVLLAGLLAQHLFDATTYKRAVERAVTDRTADLETANSSLRAEVEQRRRVEAALVVARDRAEAANRAKSQFLATMSHELRTPLNAIIGFSDIILREDAPTVESHHVADYAQEINVSGLKLLQIINELLDLSQLDSDSVVLEEVPVSLPEILEITTETVRSEAQAAGIGLKCEVQGQLPLVLADERRLTKAMVNLVSNAIKFTPPGGSAAVSVREGLDGTVTVDVTDTGIGIPAGEEQRIQEPFVQLAEDLARHRNGAGLGLAFVKRISDLHGLSLSIDSKLGIGTRVSLTFPKTRVLGRVEAA